jgi:hypothetical protein
MGQRRSRVERFGWTFAPGDKVMHKRLVVLVGQKKAVAIAVCNVSGRRRWSKLTECLASKVN